MYVCPEKNLTGYHLGHSKTPREFIHNKFNEYRHTLQVINTVSEFAKYAFKRVNCKFLKTTESILKSLM